MVDLEVDVEFLPLGILKDYVLFDVSTLRTCLVQVGYRLYLQRCLINQRPDV